MANYIYINDYFRLCDFDSDIKDLTIVYWDLS